MGMGVEGNWKHGSIQKEGHHLPRGNAVNFRAGASSDLSLLFTEVKGKCCLIVQLFFS
jgi:hypothetical protein